MRKNYRPHIIFLKCSSYFARYICGFVSLSYFFLWLFYFHFTFHFNRFIFLSFLFSCILFKWYNSCLMKIVSCMVLRTQYGPWFGLWNQVTQFPSRHCRGGRYTSQPIVFFHTRNRNKRGNFGLLTLKACTFI